MKQLNYRLTANRFDLAFKLSYLEDLNSGKDVSQSLKYYQEHIKVFSLGSYVEPGNKNKNSIEKYISTFNSLNDDIKHNGFNGNKSQIPVARDGSILNGAHRLSVCLYHGQSFNVKVYDKEPANFDYKYFLNRGMSSECLDYGALNFVKNTEDIYIALLWPRFQISDSDLFDLFNEVIYEKKIDLNYNGAHNLLATAYRGENWLGDEHANYPGVINKLYGCFSNISRKKTVRVVAFKCDSLEKVLKIKECYRGIANIGKHSIHITDSSEEAIELAEICFNDNSIQFLNDGMPRRNLSLVNSILSTTKDKQRILSSECSLILFGFSSYLPDKLEDESDNSDYFYYRGFRFATIKLNYELFKKLGFNRNLLNVIISLFLAKSLKSVNALHAELKLSYLRAREFAIPLLSHTINKLKLRTVFDYFRGK